MSRLPSLTGEEVVKALGKAGFQVLRRRGSHAYLRLNGRANAQRRISGSRSPEKDTP